MPCLPRGQRGGQAQRKEILLIFLNIWQEFKNQPVLPAPVMVAFIRNQENLPPIFQLRQNLPRQFIPGGINYVNHIFAIRRILTAIAPKPDFFPHPLEITGIPAAFRIIVQISSQRFIPLPHQGPGRYYNFYMKLSFLPL